MDDSFQNRFIENIKDSNIAPISWYMNTIGIKRGLSMVDDETVKSIFIDGQIEMFIFLVQLGYSWDTPEFSDFLDDSLTNKNAGIMFYILYIKTGIYHFVGLDQGPEEPDAPYQILMNKEYVQKTQYRPVLIDDKQLQGHLDLDPKPNIVYSCPNGHYHSADNCGVPVTITKCSDCDSIVGGWNHYLVPGNYIVYHNGYNSSYLWYGNFPVQSYARYLKLVEQYNISASLYPDIDLIEPVDDKSKNDIARHITEVDNIHITEDTVCSICGESPVNKDKKLVLDDIYLLPDCGHVLCEECLTNARGGDINDIYGVDNFENRKCGICYKSFRFGGSKNHKKALRYHLNSSQKCVIL